jgi:hypothetical protein
MDHMTRKNVGKQQRFSADGTNSTPWRFSGPIMKQGDIVKIVENCGVYGKWQRFE